MIYIFNKVLKFKIFVNKNENGDLNKRQLKLDIGTGFWSHFDLERIIIGQLQCKKSFNFYPYIPGYYSGLYDKAEQSTLASNDCGRRILTDIINDCKKAQWMQVELDAKYAIL
ncbi:1960_t:CDS:2 [Funneliformis geosporum]|uniref:1960_t:CDS:1 n=1 Tax=Funneliformis geosporum TaxID=1117311 RepID=A0A9W4X1U1_9GLOM|nr:1960_t:CDS:2 [Funneliformis geosporum]